MFLSNILGHTRKSQRSAPSRRTSFESLEDRRMLFATYGGDAVWPFTELSYSYSNLLDNAILPTNQVITAVEEAMGIWSAYTPLRFFEQVDSGQNVNQLNGKNDDNYEPERHALIRWGHHPIDGAAGLNTLAHAYRPQEEGRGGDIHFDRQNTFDVNGFLETAVHELGHALGLAHANGDTKDGVCPPVVQAVMYACSDDGSWSLNGLGTSRLLQDDINGIRSLYGSGLGYVLNLGGVLSIYGTDGNDDLTVSVQNGVITGRTGDGRSFTRGVAGVNGINVHGLDGYDTLRVAENDSFIPVFLFGEGFDDRCEIRTSNMNWRTSAGRVTCWSGNGYDKAYIYDVGATESRDYNFNGSSGPIIEIAGSPHRMVYDQTVEEVHLITGNHADRVFVWDTYSSTHAFVNNAGGHDNIFVGNGYRLQDIRGRFTVGFPERDIATPGAYSLHLNDGANLNSPNATVATGNWSDSTGITGAAPALISWFNRPDSFVWYTTGENSSDIKIEANFTWLKLFSSGGNDRIRIGSTFGLDRITAPISFDSGTPEITIDDSVQVGVRKNRVIHVNDHLGAYQAIWGMAPAPIFYQQPDQVLLLLGPGNDELNLNDHLVSEFIAFDTGGNDTFRVNGINSAYVELPGGPFAVRTRHHRLSLAGDLATPDSLIINDQSRIDRMNYSFTAGRIESNNVDFPLGEGLIVEYATMKNTDLIANDRDNEVKVFFTPTSTAQSTFHLGGGDDYFQVFPRDETGKSIISSNIGVFGNSGIDSFYVDDRFSEFGAKWAIDNRFGPRNQTVTVADSRAITAFDDVEYIYPVGSQGDDIFNVESFQSGNQMLIIANDGNDRLYVSPSSQNVADTVTSIAYFGFDAGEGHDGIWFENQNTVGEWRYEDNGQSGLYAQRTDPNYFITIYFGGTEYIHAEGGSAVPLIIGDVPPEPVIPPPIDNLFAAIREGNNELEFDLNLDGIIDQADARFLIHDLLMTDYGDANLDRVFNSSDLVRIFQSGEYEDGVAGNSTWSEGDWTGDGEFDSADLVAAFQAGWYEVGLAVRTANPALRVSKPTIARETPKYILARFLPDSDELRDRQLRTGHRN